jgi:hypothetical protein
MSWSAGFTTSTPESSFSVRTGSNTTRLCPSALLGCGSFSWDVASTTTAASDWSVCTTWLIVKRDYYLMDLWRGRLQYPDLKRKVIDLAHEHRADVILIDARVRGCTFCKSCAATQRSLSRSALIPMATSSSAWRRRAPASRRVRSICPNKRPGLQPSSTNFSPSQTRDTTTRSTASRNS